MKHSTLGLESLGPSAMSSRQAWTLSVWDPVLWWATRETAQQLKMLKTVLSPVPKGPISFLAVGPVHMTHNHIPVSHPYMHKCFKGRKARNGSIGKACEDQTPEDFCICMSIKIYFVCMSIKVSDSLELEL